MMLNPMTWHVHRQDPHSLRRNHGGQDEGRDQPPLQKKLKEPKDFFYKKNNNKYVCNCQVSVFFFFKDFVSLASLETKI
jgi:hypothetical protein